MLQAIQIRPVQRFVDSKIETENHAQLIILDGCVSVWPSACAATRNVAAMSHLCGHSLHPTPVTLHKGNVR